MLGLAPLLLAATVSAPFTIFDNRMLVSVTVNGTPGVQMILDSGSSGVLITPQVAQRLRLRLAPSIRLTGAGAGSMRSDRARVGDVAIGSEHLGAMQLRVASLEPIRRALRFPQLDGVIGFDVLRSRYVKIDADTKTLTLSDAPIAAPRGAHITPYSLQGGLMQIAAAVDGVHSQFVLDTGDRSALTIFQPFARANGFYAISPVHANVVTGYGIGGPIRSNVIGAHLDAFGFDLPDVVTRLPLGNAGVFSTGTQAGSIGNGTLLRFNTVVDRVGHSLTQWPARTYARAPLQYTDPQLPRHALFGAALEDKPPGTSAGTTVSRVLPNTAAAAAGLAVGDLITHLNGVATPNTAAFLAEMHQLHAGERVSVAIVRGGSKKTLTAVLGAPPNENDPLVTTQYGSVLVDGSLRRTLLAFPKNATGRLPAVLIIGGIGCYSVDVAANPQDAYMHLAHDLSRAGFATMRVEKSGVGDSQGPPCYGVDLDAEERGYAAALTALRSDPRVDPARIYLFGHSIGSVQAPRLALTQHVAGIIIAEAVGRDWLEYEVRNLRRQLELPGDASASSVDAQIHEKQACMVRLLVQREPEAQIERTDPACKVQNGIYPVDAPYMQQVAAINIIGLWEKIDIPVLAIYGSSDFVTEAPDHERIVAVVNAHHRGFATYHPIEGMDHLLFVAASPKAAMDALSKTTPRMYDMDFSNAIIGWLRSASTSLGAPFDYAQGYGFKGSSRSFDTPR
jgi:alpha-beta hydrolase superfamily lysophospholipase/predicted aspartyl protease